jgi:hypothetical protein
VASSCSPECYDREKGLAFECIHVDLGELLLSMRMPAAVLVQTEQAVSSVMPARMLVALFPRTAASAAKA